jgi:hypothetical protein
MACHLILLPDLLQTSCAWVLKESRSVYKTASEGIMNLADKFFEMERAQALQVCMYVEIEAKIALTTLPIAAAASLSCDSLAAAAGSTLQVPSNLGVQAAP